MNELLPCPFCGGEAELDVGETLDDHVVKLTYYVFCYGCFVKIAYQPSEAEAIAAWNKRTPQFKMMSDETARAILDKHYTEGHNES